MSPLARFALLSVLLLTLLAYWTGLAGPLIFDDIHNLVPVSTWLHGDTGWASVVFGNSSGLLGRPVSMASFVFNAMLLGPDTFGLKLVNLLIHLANGILVFFFLRKLARRNESTFAPGPLTYWLPLLAASIWILHPLLVSTVLYVVQRMAMLSAFFTLIVLLSYLNGRDALLQGSHRRAFALLLMVAPAATLLAILSKENGVLAPVLCATLELTAFQPAIGTRRKWQSTAFIITALMVPALSGLALTIGGAGVITTGYENRSFTLGERLLTQPRVLWDYLGSLAMPAGPQLGLYHDDYPISTGLLSPPSTLIAILAWVVVIALAWRLRRNIPGFAAGTAFFLVGHALESTAFPLLMYFEHRNYLPAVGAIWALLCLAKYSFELIQHRMDHGARIIAVAAISLVLVLTAATTARAMIWRKNSTLMSQALKYHPNSRWLRLDLVAQAVNQQPPALDEARTHAGKLLASRDPSTRRLGATTLLLIDCASGMQAAPTLIESMFTGQPEPMEADLLRVFENLSDGIASHACNGLSGIQMADGLSAMLDRSRLPSGELGIWRLRFKAANLYLSAGLSDKAIKQARLAYAGGTADPQVAVFLAGQLLKRGDISQAATMVEAAEAQIREDDHDGREIIGRYRAAIKKLSTHSTTTP